MTCIGGATPLNADRKTDVDPPGLRRGSSGFGARAELIPGVLCVGVFIILASSEGGFSVTSWAPAGLFLLGLLVVTVLAYRRRLGELEPANRLALAFLAAFVVWSFASIAWAEVQGTAWTGANRALLYLIVYALFSAVTWRGSSAGIVLGLYSVGLGVVGAIALLDASGSSEAGLSLINGRFAQPTGYPNAVAALFIGGFWPAIFLASRRETPWAARGLMLATAGLLIQLALLPQSRGALIVLPIALLIYLAVVPNRLRALLFLALVGVATALVAAPILDVFEVNDAGGDIGAALSQAADGMILSCVVLLVVGAVIALLDRGLNVSERASRAAARVGGVLVGVVAVVGIVAALAAIGDPVDWAGDRWQDFKGDYDEAGFGSSRFSGDLGSGRYDFWRVAIEDEFSSSPVIGGGSDNFAVTYLRHRESGEEPLYPHSLPIRVLAGTGLIGALLLAGFAIAATISAARGRLRANTSFTRGIAAVALATMGYLALHSSGDWLWTFTAITMPVFAWLGMAAGLPTDNEKPVSLNAGRDQGRWSRRGARVAAIVLAVVGTGVATASLVLPWVAARDVEIAAAGWPANPEAAIERLDRARSLNFLSSRADLVAGTIALRMNDRRRAQDAFAKALEREPTNWYALLELGILDVLAGRRESGVAQLEQAAILNPGEPLIAAALRGARSGEPLSPEQIDRELLSRVCARVGPTAETRFCD